MACFWLCSKPKQKPNSDSVRYIQEEKLLRSDGNGGGEEESFTSSDSSKTKTVSELTGNRIMVVVDSSLEAERALEWTLSHVVQKQDTIILVHVLKSNSKSQCFEFYDKVNYIKAYQLLFSMKNMCQKRKPGVQVEIAFLKGKERGQVIVEEAKKHKLSLLVLGQRKRPILWCLFNRWIARSNRRRRWEKKKIGVGTVEYCIQNSSCLTIAVRKKSKRVGGYLISTKTHKNFWLLA